MAPERISVTVTKDTTTVRPSMADRYRAAAAGITTGVADIQ
jgi:hypothetical protein